MIYWSEAFALTLALEALFLWSVRVTVPPVRSVKPGWLILAFLGGNMVTHPIIWHFSGSAWVADHPVIGIASLEAFAIILESAGYALCARIQWPIAFAISLGANLFSAGLGFLLFAT